MSRNQAATAAELPTILAYLPRERARALAKAAFPRRRWRVLAVRDANELLAAFRRTLVDAVLVDLAGASSAPTVAAVPSNGEEAWRIAALAHEFPSAPFFGITAFRTTDAPVVARCAALDLCDVIAEAIDEPVVRQLVTPQTFSARFAVALAEPPEGLRLRSATQLSTWRAILASAGRPVRTGSLADTVGVSREHLSRNFPTAGAPNLKRVIDLVRMIAAAELAKNPGLDLRDVASILGFASSSHLAVTAQRVIGTRPISLSRLRTVDLIERFLQGRTRSRG